MAPRHYATAAAGERLGRSARTIHDWITEGCLTPKGRVRLPAMKLDREWQVTDEALAVCEQRARLSSDKPDLDLESPVPRERS